ncbi:MAG: hypothetical protein GEU86_22440 [Actinophytocola sp.]|nr:hypothetical protein [Actinophytocola sp.]
MTITGYHNQSVSLEPEVTEMSLEASFDDGATWEQVATESMGDNVFTARITHPKLKDTTGAVSLRVRAEDADGSTIEQTIEHAYGLK